MCLAAAWLDDSILPQTWLQKARYHPWNNKYIQWTMLTRITKIVINIQCAGVNDWITAHKFSSFQNLLTAILPVIHIQWNLSGKDRKVSLKLQNLVHFHAPFFTNHIYFTPRDRPPLLKGHHLGCLNTLRPKQNGRHFADGMFKCIFLNENVWTSIEISLKFVPKGSINNNTALFQIMAWRRPGDKPLS